jgi:hypothetical protein
MYVQYQQWAWRGNDKINCTILTRVKLVKEKQAGKKFDAVIKCVQTSEIWKKFACI